MKVNQQAIAELLGIDRTTVTKILNRDPRYSASELTKERVFRAAELLGYDFATIRRPFKREYGRTEVSVPCSVVVKLEDDEEFDRGSAVVRNISVGGALVAELRLPRNVLPLQNFTLALTLEGMPELEGIVGECEVVRLAGSTRTGDPEFGVRFINTTHRDRRRIREYVDRQVRARQAEMAELAAGRQAGEPAE